MYGPSNTYARQTGFTLEEEVELLQGQLFSLVSHFYALPRLGEREHAELELLDAVIHLLDCEEEEPDKFKRGLAIMQVIIRASKLLGVLGQHGRVKMPPKGSFAPTDESSGFTGEGSAWFQAAQRGLVAEEELKQIPPRDDKMYNLAEAYAELQKQSDRELAETKRQCQRQQQQQQRQHLGFQPPAPQLQHAQISPVSKEPAQVVKSLSNQRRFTRQVPLGLAPEADGQRQQFEEEEEEEKRDTNCVIGKDDSSREGLEEKLLHQKLELAEEHSKAGVVTTTKAPRSYHMYMKLEHAKLATQAIENSTDLFRSLDKAEYEFQLVKVEYVPVEEATQLCAYRFTFCGYNGGTMFSLWQGHLKKMLDRPPYKGFVFQSKENTQVKPKTMLNHQEGQVYMHGQYIGLASNLRLFPLEPKSNGKSLKTVVPSAEPQELKEAK